MKTVWIAGFIGVFIIAGVLLFLNSNKSSITVTPPQEAVQTPDIKFESPKKSAHFESNTPEHATSLATVPINVVINFNFDLAMGSEIKIVGGNKDYATGETIVDPNKLTMRRKVDQASPDGLYIVNYKACWADGSCHDGSFQFAIDKSLSKDFTDMTNKKEVVINMQNFAFTPVKIKVSKGTKITWNNEDSAVHTVSTDSHPAHTYFPDQNSRDLQKGDSYSVTFEDEGIYLYHCTPHASTMQGQIIVGG